MLIKHYERILFAAFCLLNFLSISTALAQPPIGSVVINEVVIDSRGSSMSEKEFIELYSTQPNLSLAGLSVITIVGVSVPSSGINPGQIIRRFDLPATARTNSQGYYLLGNIFTRDSYRVNVDLMFDVNNRLTNEPQTIALVLTSVAPEVDKMVQSSPTLQSGLYDAVALTDASPGASFYLGAPVLGPDRTYLAAGAVRVRDGVKTGDKSDWALADIEAPPTPTYNTPGAPNQVGGQAVVIDAPSVRVDVEAANNAVAPVPTTPPGGQSQSYDWKVYDLNQANASVQSAGSVFVYARSRRYKFCEQFERNVLLHPQAQALMADNPKYFMNVDDPGYGRLASDIGIYRIPMMAFKRRGGEWEYIVITPETTGQEIQAFLSK
ncbi:MAG: hypothetical protein ACFCU1_07045 [Sumerlaeia bacterium]